MRVVCPVIEHGTQSQVFQPRQGPVGYQLYIDILSVVLVIARAFVGQYQRMVRQRPVSTVFIISRLQGRHIGQQFPDTSGTGGRIFFILNGAIDIDTHFQSYFIKRGIDVTTEIIAVVIQCIGTIQAPLVESAQ